MPDHAYLSASSSHRWLECPPSAKLCAEHPGRGSPFAQQGTDAHALAAFKLENALGRKCQDPTENLMYYDAEMADCTDAYAAFVMEQLAEARKLCKDPLVQVEQKVSFSRWVPEGFGTADACIVADDTMYVIDLKYGRSDHRQNNHRHGLFPGILQASRPGNSQEHPCHAATLYKYTESMAGRT